MRLVREAAQNAFRAVRERKYIENSHARLLAFGDQQYVQAKVYQHLTKNVD